MNSGQPCESSSSSKILLGLDPKGPDNWKYTNAHHLLHPLYIRAAACPHWHQPSWTRASRAAEWLQDAAERWSHLEVSVDDAHSVEIVHGVQDLADQSAGILLCIKPLLHYPVKQLSTGHPGKKEHIRSLKGSVELWRESFQCEKKSQTLLQKWIHLQIEMLPPYSSEAIARKCFHVTAEQMSGTK